jgi:uncharacterized protein YbaR (Trm112 family)
MAIVVCPKCRTAKHLVVHTHGMCYFRSPVGEDGNLLPSGEVIVCPAKTLDKLYAPETTMVAYRSDDGKTELIVTPDDESGILSTHAYCTKCSTIFDIPDQGGAKCQDVE